MIIGLTGRNAAGKGAVADILKAHGFAYFSLSDVIRDVLAKRNEDPTRENMIRTGNELRGQGGPGALATGILELIDKSQDTIIDSIRNPKEVLVLQTQPSFTMLEVVASEGVRFERIKARGRIGDPTDLATFRELEARELEGNPDAQQLLATAALADRQLSNEGNMDALETATKTLLSDLQGSR